MTMSRVAELTILLLASFDDRWRMTAIMQDVKMKILTEFTIERNCKSLYVFLYWHIDSIHDCEYNVHYWSI